MDLSASSPPGSGDPFPLVPGAPPRTSTPPTAPDSVRITVHPVGRSLSVWCPTLTPWTASEALREIGRGLPAADESCRKNEDAIIPPWRTQS